MPWDRNPMASRTAEEIEDAAYVSLGTSSLDPDHIHLPWICVHGLTRRNHEKRIAQRTKRDA